MTKVTAALTGQVGVFLLGAITNILLARTLGPAGKGTFSLTILIATTVMTLTHLSLSNANTHYMSKNPSDRPATVGNSVFIAFVWGMIVTVLAFAFFNYFGSKLFPELGIRFWGMALAAVVPLLLFEIGGGLVLGIDRMRDYSTTLILREGLFLLGALFLYSQGIISPSGAVALWVVATTIAAFANLSVAWRGTEKGKSVSIALFKSMAGYSGKSHIANVTSFLRLRFDMFLVAGFLSVTEVGYYGIAVTLIGLLWFIPTAVSQALVPYISLRDNETANDLTPRLCRISFIIALFGAVLLGSAGYAIIGTLFGKVFLPAYIPLLVLLPGALFYGLAKMLAGDLLGRGMPGYAMTISAIAFAVNLCINMVFIPRWGITGAALSASLTQILVGILFIRSFVKASDVKVSELFIIQRDDFSKLWRADR